MENISEIDYYDRVIKIRNIFSPAKPFNVVSFNKESLAFLILNLVLPVEFR